MPELPKDAKAFDTETRGLLWFQEDEQAFLGTWADEKQTYVDTLIGEGAGAAYLSALAGAKTLVAHNLKFDAHQTEATLGYELMDDHPWQDTHDTDLMSRVLMPEGQRKDRGGHGLKNLSTVFLREDAGDAEKAIEEVAKKVLGRKTLKAKGAYYDVWRAYPKVMEKYALLDARYTYDLAAHFLPMFDDDARLWQLYNMERQVQRVLYNAEKMGVRTDQQRVAKLSAFYSNARDSAAQRCVEAFGFIPEKEELNEGEKLTERLSEGLRQAGVELTELTDSGTYATNKQVLMPFQDHPAVEALFDFRRVNKFQQTYIDPMIGRDYVHADANQAEAWTGRMSYRRPNLQNLPKRSETTKDENMMLRSMFVPRDDHYFVIADFNSVEPRLLAHYLGVPWYRTLVDEGQVYEHTCVTAFGGKPEDYRKGGPKPGYRDWAKLTFLSITYGAGGAVVRRYHNQILRDRPPLDPGWVKDPTNKYDTPPQAQALKKKIVAGIPGFGTWNSGLRGRVEGKIKREGFVRTLMGRKQVVDPEKSYVGLNALIQGSAADIMKSAAVNLYELEGTPLLFVHDEVVMEYPKDYAPDRAMAEVKEAMECAAEIKPGLRADVTWTDLSYAHGD